MTNLERLKKAETLSDLASLLGYEPKKLAYIVYKIPENEKYTEFTIPKRSGGERRIKAPVGQLKILQRKLADLLTRCLDDINQINGNKKPLSHGFRSGCSIITNARNHQNKRHVLNIDIKDFFPSFNFGRVRGFFIKNNNFSLNEKVATIIAQVAIHQNELPQGSPCSPIISNLVGHILDIRLVNLAKKYKCTYSRYADDITFSTNKSRFPKELAVPAKALSFITKKDINLWKAGSALTHEIERTGFSINSKKTSLQHRTNRQVATGLVVNEKINIKREYYLRARSMCHSLFFTNKFRIPTPTNSLDPFSAGTINQLEGILGYIYSVKREHDERKMGTRYKYPNSISNLYGNFLLYKHFFSLSSPLIVCEGKTDIIYLRCAINSLASDYVDLAGIIENTVEYNIKFLKSTAHLRDVFSIAEGASGLKNLMVRYKENIGYFKANGMKHPVIVLVDHDDGTDQIYNLVNNNFNEHGYARYHENMYVVRIPPKPGNAHSEIEDLFDAETLSTVLDGKTFNRSNRSRDINTENEYGKMRFAEKVVRENQKTINFNGFRNLLNSFVAVIRDYAEQTERTDGD